MKHDELTVGIDGNSTHSPPDNITLNDLVAGNVRCQHGNQPMSSTFDGRYKYQGRRNGLIRIRFLFKDCPCVLLRQVVEK